MAKDWLLVAEVCVYMIILAHVQISLGTAFSCSWVIAWAMSWEYHLKEAVIWSFMHKACVQTTNLWGVDLFGFTKNSLYALMHKMYLHVPKFVWMSTFGLWSKLYRMSTFGLWSKLYRAIMPSFSMKFWDVCSLFSPDLQLILTTLMIKFIRVWVLIALVFALLGRS